jgi:ABC-type nitrate/sulfonate/bicarbonate transport system substrate-binding protein
MYKHKFNLLSVSIAVILIGLMALTACSGSSSTAKSELSTVRYGGQLYPEEYLLKGQDFWSKYGLTVEHTLFSSGGENNQALISGAIDINIGSDSKSVALFNAMPGEVVIIAASQRGDRYSTMVKTGSGITSWYDMKGQTVGIRLGTGAEQVVRRYLDTVDDLSWEDFNWVDLKVEDMAAALADGSIASFTAWEPTPAIAEATGDAQVMMSYGQYALTPVLIHTTKAYAETHHDELVAFLKGQLDKVDMIQNNPDEAARIAAEAASASGSEVDPAVFKTIFERVNFSLDVDDEVVAALNDTAQFLKDQGTIDTIPEFSVDTSFLQEAEQSR